MTGQRPRRRVLPAPIRSADRKAGRRIYNAHTPPPVTGGFARLSSVSERAVFWMVIAGLVALTGPRGRRAAAQGAGTLVVASGLANLVGKNVIRAPRPRLHALRHRRGGLRTPSSSGFPSGHSATAAAFATSVGVISPLRGGIVGVLAALVAASRLYVGVHWLSDVIARNALGIAVAVLGKRVVRRHG